MSRVLKPFGAQTSGSDLTKSVHWDPLTDTINLIMLGVLGRNIFAGGSQDFWLDASSAGDFDLPSWLPIEVDNLNSQISGSTNIVVQFRYFLRVSSASISATPKIFDITANAAATISGAAACSATAEDFSGANQQQTISLTLPAAKHVYKTRVTVAGAPTAGMRVWGLAMYDCYVNG